LDIVTELLAYQMPGWVDFELHVDDEAWKVPAC
jgi:hypothetical protein